MDHLECVPNNREGCSHCHITEPTICCDLHHPTAFSLYNSDISTTQHNPQCSRLQKVMKNKYDYTLQDTLEDWWESKTTAVYGWACLNDHGPSLVMPLSILDQIVDCTHHHKLQSAQDLKWEMGWTDVEKFGDEIIVLVKLHAAPCSSPFVSTPLRNMPSSTGISTPNIHTDMPSHRHPVLCFLCFMSTPSTVAPNAASSVALVAKKVTMVSCYVCPSVQQLIVRVSACNRGCKKYSLCGRSDNKENISELDWNCTVMVSDLMSLCSR